MKYSIQPELSFIQLFFVHEYYRKTKVDIFTNQLKE